MNTAYLCPGCGRPIGAGQPPDDGITWTTPPYWCTDCGGSANVRRNLQLVPRWYALVSAAFDKISVMPLVLDPDMVEPLWDQALSGAQATSEPDDDELDLLNAAERTAMAIAILAYGVDFAKAGPPETLAEIEADRMKPEHLERLLLMSRDRAEDGIEVAMYEHPHVGYQVYVGGWRVLTTTDKVAADTRFVTELTRPLSEADRARAAHFDDPTLTNQEYGRLVEEADEADQQRELAAEVPPAEEADDETHHFPLEIPYRLKRSELVLEPNTNSAEYFDELSWIINNAQEDEAERILRAAILLWAERFGDEDPPTLGDCLYTAIIWERGYMDPNQLYKDTMELAHALQDGTAVSPRDAAEELATNVIELDHWIANGGFLPQEWQPKVKSHEA